MHPVLLTLPSVPLTVRAYATCLVLAVLVGWWVGPRWAARSGPIDPRTMRRVLLLLTVAAFAGARLHFVVTHWARFSAAPATALRLWDGGLHAGGGILGPVLAAPLVLRRVGVPLARFADVCAPTAALALAIVRLGCFLKGCCAGVACTGPWCVRFPRTTHLFLLQAHAGLVPPDAAHTAPVHPLQLYFLAAALLVMAVSRWLHPRRRYDGQVALVALVLYGATSAGLECLRGEAPARAYWGALPSLAWTALAIFTVAGLALVVAERRHRGRPAAAPLLLARPPSADPAR